MKIIIIENCILEFPEPAILMGSASAPPVRSTSVIYYVSCLQLFLQMKPVKFSTSATVSALKASDTIQTQLMKRFSIFVKYLHKLSLSTQFSPRKIAPLKVAAPSSPPKPLRLLSETATVYIKTH